MAHGESLRLAAIQPPAPRLVAQGTYTLAETAERKRLDAAAFAANQKPKVTPRPQFAADHLKIAALDKEAKAAFRARKRAWRGRYSPRLKCYLGGVDLVVEKIFRGLASLASAGMGAG